MILTIIKLKINKKGDRNKMSMKTDKAQRYFLQCLIDETKEVIDNANRTARRVTLTPHEQNYLRRLIFQMSASVSTPDKRVSAYGFITDYMKLSFSSTNKIVFIDRKERQTSYQNLMNMLNICEKIADERFGKLKIKDVNAMNDILVVQ